MKRWLLVLLLIASSAAKAFELSPPVTAGPAATFTLLPRIASNGDGYLVVWADHRSDRSDDLAVRGMLLDDDGRLRRERDFAIVPAPAFPPSDYDGRKPLAVASNGNDYLVAYDDRTSTHFVRVDGEGAVHPARDTIDGTLRAFVAWRSYYAAIVESWGYFTLVLADQHGQVVKMASWEVFSSFEDADLLATADGRLMLLLVDRYKSTRSIAFLTLGEFFHPGFSSVNVRASVDDANARQVAIAESGGRFLLVQAFASDLNFSLFDQDGALLRAETRKAPELYGSFAVSPLASGFVLIGDYVVTGKLPSGYPEYSMAALRLSANLDPETATFQHLGSEARGLATIALPDGGAMLAFGGANGTCCVNGFWATRVQHLSPSGEKLLGVDGAVVSVNFPTQGQAVVQQCGDVFAVAWLDRWSGHTQVSLRRFLGDGTPLDPPNRAIQTLSAGEQADLALTCGRESMLLSWWDLTTYERRFAFIRLHGSDVAIRSRYGSEGAAIFDGEDFVVFDGAYGRGQLTRWTEAGELLDLRTVLSGRRLLAETALSWSGQYFFVAWDDAHDFGHGTLFVRRLDRHFNFAGPEIEIARPSQGLFNAVRIAAHPDGGAVAAWGVCGGGIGGDACIPYTARVHRDGFLLDHPGGQTRGGATPLYWGFGFYTALDFWWNGSAFELMSEEGLTTIEAEGRSVLRRFALEAEVRPVALTRTGNHRMLVSSRRDPESGLMRLHGTFVDATSWQLPPEGRRRSVGH